MGKEGRLTRLDLLESILEFYLGYEKIYKFDVWNGFLGLENRMFETFRKNYVSRKGHMLGDKRALGLKDLDRMKRENVLSQLFDLEVLAEVENKFVEEENPTGSPQNPKTPKPLSLFKEPASKQN